MSILEHHFPPLIAERYGVFEAVLLRDIYHWCVTNRNNGEYFLEGRWWTYQTMKGFCLRHTYWTKNQVEHIIKNCKKKGALLSGHFSDDPFNRTCWYSLTDEGWALFEGPLSKSDISEMDSKEFPVVDRKNQKCYKDKHIAEDKAIPPIPPKGGRREGHKKDKSVPAWNPERFEAFWEYYRTHARGEDRQGAVRAWDKLQPDDALIATMGRALQAQVRSEGWREGVGIPYAATWLNNARWTDTPKAPHGPEPPEEEGERFGWR